MINIAYMNRLSAIVTIVLIPLGVCAMDRLSETDLSNFSTNNSLNIGTQAVAEESGSFWSRYLRNPANMDFFQEDNGESTEKKEPGSLQIFSYKFPEYTTVTSVVDSNDPSSAGMSRLEFPNGLVRANEGPVSVEVWLGGLPSDKNAGKMCDFYSNQIRSITLPNSSISVSTH